MNDIMGFVQIVNGRLQWRADRRANVNVHTDRTRIFYPTCEMNTLRWLETVSSTFQDLEYDGSLQPLCTC